MIPVRVRPLLVFAAIASSCFAQNSSSPATAPSDPYRDEPYVFEKLDSTLRMKPDGTGERLTHVVLRVQSEGTARQFAVLSVSYASANEAGSIDYVRVHKADGSTVETPTTDAIEMPAEISRQAPVYSDIREKHVPVRSLSVGDRLEYQLHIVRTKAEAPNAWWGAEHFATGEGVLLSQTITLEAPASMYLQVWSPNHPVTSKETNGLKTWTWTYAQTKPSARDENGRMTAAVVKDPDEDSDGRKLPSIAWTTFHSWAEIGDWYRGLALQRAEPNDAIKAKAEELTKNAKTPEEQVRAIYRYVASQTRYVGIGFGVGRIQPHAAAEVLSNQYGDCKDKDTLLESLLKAKGFTTAPALIGAGIVAVPEVPTPAVFNHVITTVQLPGTPDRIWLDSTAEVAPYRVLMPVLRDVNALLVPATSPASLVKTPADPPFPYREVFNADATLDNKGLLKSHMRESVRSDGELEFRVMLRQVSPSQWDQAMQIVSQAMGFGGKVSNTDLRQGDPAAPVQLAWDYTREEYADWKNGNILPVFPALEIVTIDKEKAPEHDIDLGAPRTLEAHTVIALPEGYRAELPEARHVKRDYTTYDQTYRLADGKLYVDRTVVVLQHKVPKAQWKDYTAFTHAAGLDAGENYIHLIAPAKSSDTKNPMKEDKSSSNDPLKGMDASTRELMADATSAMQRNNFAEERRILEQVRKRDPNTPYLMSMLAYAEAREGKIDQAVADLETEVKNHPDDIPAIIVGLAGFYLHNKQFEKAETLLKSYRDPDDFTIRSMLAMVQAQQGKHAEAAASYEVALKVKPDDRNMEYLVANELYEAKRFDEAVSHAHHAIEGSDDPNVLNNNAYLLSEMKRDLSFAEENSRRSIALLEKATAETPVDSAKDRTFAASSNMTASWDTLAYILLLEGKAAEALPWFRAAWMNRPEVVVGDHLGQVYEALNQKPRALAIYRLALATENASAAKPDYDAANAAEARLEKEGVNPSWKDQPSTIQAMRTHKIQRPAGLSGGGTVRVVIAKDAVAEALLVSGDNNLKPVLDEIRGMKLEGYTPPSSSGHVFRDAVLYCGASSPTCDFVFLLRNGIQAEGDAR
jgi:tetratricopeptide (TPR) repeat protein